MLQVARLAGRVLGESAELVQNFLASEFHTEGGFKDRSGRPDLYYTVFGVDASLALAPDGLTAASFPWPAFARYASSFGNGAGLDFVHLCCLARCVGALHRVGVDPNGSTSVGPEILQRIEEHRSRDGGYHPKPAADHGTAYGAFLALGAYQDLGARLPRTEKLASTLERLAVPGGGWGNEPGMKTGSTNASAAAVAVCRNLGIPINQGTGDWLLAQKHPQGGFRASPDAPIPDLLSTATALHALAGLQVSLAQIKEPCLDFLDTLWTSEGSFHGHWAEDHLDCEYTFYGLLALGHLSVA